MDVLHPRCAGLDVHEDSVVAAVRLAGDGPARAEVRSFATTTPELLKLPTWLGEAGCTHVAMEATGVYWKPVWHVLSDGDAMLILANAMHVENVPGRKTDVADAAWLADLLAHGLIRASFVPEQPTQELRALLRTRKRLVREQASHVQRSGTAFFSACTRASSMPSRPPWPTSTRRWTTTSTLSGWPWDCCAPSPASLTVHETGATSTSDHGWPGLGAIGKVVRRRQVGDRTSTETAYCLPSIPLAPERLNEVARLHWGVENRLHWRLDAVMDEDQDRTRRDNGPQNIAVLRHMALEPMQKEGSKGSLRGKFKRAGWNEAFLSSLLAAF